MACKSLSPRLVRRQDLIKFRRLAGRYKGDNLVVTTHKKVDWDGAASAAVLAKIMGWRFALDIPTTEDSILRGLSKMGFDPFPCSEINPEEYKGAIIVDINTPAMLPASILRWIDEEKILLVIDHHRLGAGFNLGEEKEIINPDATATASMVAELLLDKYRAQITKEMAMSLTAGIYADSMKLGVIRDNKLFPMFYELLEIAGVTAQTVKNIVYAIPTLDEAGLIMYGLQVAELYEHKGIGISVTHCDGMVQRRVVETLSDICPVSIVASNEDKTAVTMRVGDELFINGAKIMKELGEMHGGSGGGHEKSAGCSGNGDVETMLSDAIRLVREAINEIA